MRGAGGERLQVKSSEGFGFGGESECLIEVRTDHHQAVIRHEGGSALRQCGDDVIGKLLRAEGGVGGAPDLRSAEQRHQIMDRGKVVAQTRHGGRVFTVGVDDRGGIGTRPMNGQMEGHFRGGLAGAGDVAG